MLKHDRTYAQQTQQAQQCSPALVHRDERCLPGSNEGNSAGSQPNSTAPNFASQRGRDTTRCHRHPTAASQQRSVAVPRHRPSSAALAEAVRSARPGGGGRIPRAKRRRAEQFLNERAFNVKKYIKNHRGDRAVRRGSRGPTSGTAPASCRALAAGARRGCAGKAARTAEPRPLRSPTATERRGPPGRYAAGSIRAPRAAQIRSRPSRKPRSVRIPHLPHAGNRLAQPPASHPLPHLTAPRRPPLTAPPLSSERRAAHAPQRQRLRRSKVNGRRAGRSRAAAVTSAPPQLSSPQRKSQVAPQANYGFPSALPVPRPNSGPPKDIVPRSETEPKARRKKKEVEMTQ